MTKLQHLDFESIEIGHRQRFVKLSTAEKLNESFTLIDLTGNLNRGKPPKEPQGNGIVIRKSTSL
ncbi:MAG: hypothetical protein U0Y10_19305 [Spirosomataceae bacterium]